MKNWSARASLGFEGVEHLRSCSTRMHREYSPARLCAGLQDAGKHRLLQLEAFSAMRTPIQADFADIARLSEKVLKQRHFHMPLRDYFGVQSERHPYSLTIADDALCARPRLRAGCYR
jgi:hypothetical protein